MEHRQYSCHVEKERYPATTPILKALHCKRHLLLGRNSKQNKIFSQLLCKCFLYEFFYKNSVLYKINSYFFKRKDNSFLFKIQLKIDESPILTQKKIICNLKQMFLEEKPNSYKSVAKELRQPNNLFLTYTAWEHAMNRRPIKLNRSASKKTQTC